MDCGFKNEKKNGGKIRAGMNEVKSLKVGMSYTSIDGGSD